MPCPIVSSSDDPEIIYFDSSAFKHRDVMSGDVLSVDLETDLGEIADLVLEHRISALPVVTPGTHVGIIGSGDVLRAARDLP